MLSLQEIASMRNERADVNHDTYKLILGQCMYNIRQNVLYSDSVDFTLPPWIPGRPLYNIEHAIRYLIDKLSYHGYVVTRKAPQTIHVSWKQARKPKRDGKKSDSSTKSLPEAPQAVQSGVVAAPPPPAASSSDTEAIVQKLQRFNKQVKRIVLR
jgi:hypothetical protein